MAYTAGTGFVQVAPSLKGFHQQIRTELAAIKESVSVKVTPDFDRASWSKAPPRVPDQNVKVKAEVDTRSWVDASNAAAQFVRNLSTPATFVAATTAIPTLLAFTSAAGTASGALLAVPAAGASAAAVMGTVKIATSGMSDAFKQVFAADRNPEKLAAALANVSPQARAFVQSVDAIRPTLDSIRVDVQDAAFRGLGTTLTGLAGTYLPVARAGFTGIAAEINTGTQSVARFVGEAQTVSTVRDVFTQTATSVRILSPAMTDILTILRAIVQEGLPYLSGLSQGFVNLTARAREFILEAQRTGDLSRWIGDGIRAVVLLGQTFVNVGGIIAGILRANDADALGFLTRVRDITAATREWVNSVQGQTVLRELFANLRDLASALGPLLWEIASAGAGIGMALLPILPDVVRLITEIIIAARPWLAAFTELAVAILPPLVDFLRQFSSELGFLAAAVITGIGAYKLYAATVVAIELVTKAWAIAQGILNGTLVANPIGLVVVALAALAAGLVYAWNHSETFRNVVTGAWEAVKSAFSTAWVVIQDVYNGIVEAGRTAATWVSQTMTDIGNAVRGVGQWFTDLWQTYVVPAWNGIVEAGKIALAILLTVVLAPIQIALNVAGAAWDALKVIAVAAWNVIKEEGQIWWDFLKGIFDAVVNFLGPIFAPVWHGFRDLVVGVWDFLSTRISNWWNSEVLPVWNAVVNFLTFDFSGAHQTFQTLVTGVWNALWALLSDWWNTKVLPLWNFVIGFMAGAFATAWNTFRDLVVAVWNALWQRITTWWNAEVLPVWNTIVGFLASIFGPAFNTARDVVIAAWNVMRDTMNTVWAFIRDNIWQPLVNFITVTIPNGFQAGVDRVGALWNGIKAALRTPLQAAIDIVWNNGIAKVWGLVQQVIPGLPGIPGVPFTLPGLAAGGPVRRPTVAMIGEAGPEVVLSNPAVRNMGGVAAAEKFHQSMRGSPRTAVSAMNAGKVVEGADHNGPGSSTVGFGGVRPHVAQAGHYLKNRFGIGVVGGVGARANASDHPSGHALDFMTTNGDPLANFLSSPANWAHFAIKYQIWRQRIMSRPGVWTPMANRGSPTANHMDHVHVSFLGGPGSGAMDGGGGGPSILELLTKAWELVKTQVGKLGSIAGAGSMWGQAVTGFGRKIVDSAWNYLAGRAGEMMATASANMAANGVAVVGPNGEVIGTVGGAGSPQAQVNAVAARYGWGGGAQWSALVQLVQRESSWNPNAANPTSSARGLFQQMTSVHGPVAPTAGGQAEWGLNYIRSRYGSPSAALAFHNANGYYDAGGMAAGRGLLAKSVIAPERVLSPRQTDAFEQLVATISRGRGTVSTDRYGRGHREGIGGAVGGEGGTLIGSLTVPVPEGAGIQETLDHVFTRARYEQRRGRYSRR